MRERAVLAAMPLHAITTLHGEAGLRQRLAAEIAPMPQADRERIERALALAARLHAQDREHVAASLDTDPWARVIKLSDFTDNGVGLIHTTGPALTRLAAKYA